MPTLRRLRQDSHKFGAIGLRSETLSYQKGPLPFGYFSLLTGMAGVAKPCCWHCLNAPGVCLSGMPSQTPGHFLDSGTSGSVWWKHLQGPTSNASVPGPGFWCDVGRNPDYSPWKMEFTVLPFKHRVSIEVCWETSAALLSPEFCLKRCVALVRIQRNTGLQELANHTRELEVYVEVINAFLKK